MPDTEAPRARWLCIVCGAKCWMENFGAAGSYNGGTQPILGRHQEGPPLCKGLRHEGAQSWRNQEAERLEGGERSGARPRWGLILSQAKHCRVSARLHQALLPAPLEVGLILSQVRPARASAPRSQDWLRGHACYRPSSMLGGPASP